MPVVSVRVWHSGLFCLWAVTVLAYWGARWSFAFFWLEYRSSNWGRPDISFVPSFFPFRFMFRRSLIWVGRLLDWRRSWSIHGAWYDISVTLICWLWVVWINVGFCFISNWCKKVQNVLLADSLLGVWLFLVFHSAELRLGKCLLAVYFLAVVLLSGFQFWVLVVLLSSVVRAVALLCIRGLEVLSEFGPGWNVRFACCLFGLSSGGFLTLSIAQ